MDTCIIENTKSRASPGTSAEASGARRRKRRRIAEEDRKRTTVACAPCRRLKEKCDGKVPCERCRRHDRACEVKPAEPRIAPTATHWNTGDDDDERIKHLETIVRHFLGETSLETESLSQIVRDLETQRSNVNDGTTTADIEGLALDEEPFELRTLSQHTAHYSSELSHWNFSQKVRDRVERQLQTPRRPSPPILDYWRAHHLRSSDAVPQVCSENIPPREVAVFLTEVYFDYAQTNTYFVDQQWLLGKLDLLHQLDRSLNADDAPWMCTVLMVLAVGSQFAHTVKNPQATRTAPVCSDADEATEDAVGVTLYHIASKLVADIITIASVEGVQAFLLLAHFTLPIDTHGLAYTYVGLALRMAVQNGMHRKYQDNYLAEGAISLRNRLWWTAYCLEKRISILHGRPASISHADVDVRRPSDIVPETQADIGSPRVNMNTMTRLTEWLESFADPILSLRTCSKRLRLTQLERLLKTREQFKRWWASQAVSQTPGMPLTRSTAHLHLSYHMNLIFMGRPFMFTAIDDTVQQEPCYNRSCARLELVADAVDSACEVINICAMLEKTTDLARASYVEFSSLRAAVLVMFAESLNGRCHQFHNQLTSGTTLVRTMAVSMMSTKSEASLISAIDATIHQFEADAEGAKA